LKSFTFETSAACPAGYTSLGKFNITSYVLANEAEFAEKPTVKDPCGLTGTFRKDFLFETSQSPYGVKMEGSGKSISGKYIHYEEKDGKDCFKVVNCALTATSGVCATKGRTAAWIQSYQKGSTILIQDIGERVAEDTGDVLRVDTEIDVYQGEDMTAAGTKSLRRRS
jgi:hypothetical protein